MPISIPTDRVKARCALSGSEHDNEINALAGELRTACEALVEPAAWSAESLAPLLSLALIELTAAEYLAERFRREGILDVVTIGDLRHEPVPPDFEAMRRRAWSYLTPLFRVERQAYAKLLAGGSKFEGQTTP